MTNQSYRRFGLAGIFTAAGVALTLTAQSIAPIVGSAVGSALGANGIDLKPPQAWRVNDLNAMELEDLGDIDWRPVESGSMGNSETAIFEGENTVSVWDAGPAKLIYDEPFGYDEFVVVLKGTLILTDNEGNQATYGEGDMFMVPKGFTGTWNMTEEYRELIVVDTLAYNAE